MGKSEPSTYIPKQRRSIRTRQRLLAATRQLLVSADLEDLTIQQIVERAGCSVGNFYQRFQNKDAMIPDLLELHYDELRVRVEAMIRDNGERCLEDRVAAVVGLVVGMAEEQASLIRTLALRNHKDPESIPRSIRQAASEILGAIYGFVLGDRNEIRHPRPLQAVEVGMLMAAAAVRERLAFAGATQAATLTVDSKDFADEITRALVAYLRLPEIDARSTV